MRKRKPFLCILALLALTAGHQSVSAQEATKLDPQALNKFRRATKLLYSGERLFLSRKYDRAEKKLQACNDVFPHLSKSYFYLCQLYYRKGMLEQAFSSIETAKNHFKYVVDLQNMNQQEYLDTLREEKEELTKYLNSEMTKANAEERDKIFNKLSVIEERLKTPFVLAEDINIPADYFYWHGNCFMKAKQYNDAHAQYSRAIETDKKHANAYNNLVNLYFMFKRYPEAMKLIEQAEKEGLELNEKLVAAVREKNTRD